MKKNTKRIILFSCLALIIVVVIGVINKENPVKEQIAEETLSGQAGHTIDVVGSRIGTSTTGVAFANNTASTTYPIAIGRNYDTVEFYFKALTVETGGGHNVRFSLVGSNDYDCDTSVTATTSTGWVNNCVFATDINWFDMGSHLRNLAGSKTTVIATSTFYWTPASTSDGTSFVFEDLNTKCLALEINASGTSLWVEAVRKDFK